MKVLPLLLMNDRNPPPRLNPTSVLASGAQLVLLSAAIGDIILTITGTAPSPSFTSQHGHQCRLFRRHTPIRWHSAAMNSDFTTQGRC
uniref:G-protein coupled receptors family 1 profile domain-containing protein n=1 Tax=Panagrellus redivivus TaxID=6233 RepID=A0A7E4W496_PANRE